MLLVSSKGQTRCEAGAESFGSTLGRRDGRVAKVVAGGALPVTLKWLGDHSWFPAFLTVISIAMEFFERK
jgi:hypothetical protein